MYNKSLVLCKLCKLWINDLYYSHNAAISLGRSVPNRPKRWLLASRSKGEWLRMELKVNGYIARGKPVMWRTWCSLLVAMVKSAAGGSGDFSLNVLLFCLPASSSSGACVEFEVGCCHSAPPSSCWLLLCQAAGRREGCCWNRKRDQGPRDQDLTRYRLCRKGGKRRLDTGTKVKPSKHSGLTSHLISKQFNKYKTKISIAKTIAEKYQMQTPDEE